MKLYLVVLASLLLIACGGSGSGSSGAISGPPPSGPNQSQFSGANCPSYVTANAEAFCLMHREYLWYREMPQTVNLTQFNSTNQLVQALSAPNDRFSYTMSAADYQSRFIDARFFGFGMSFRIVDNDSALLVRFVYDDGSAAENGLRRGDRITEIEGKSIAEWYADIDAGRATNDDMFGPNDDGVMRNFVWTKPDGTVMQSDFIKREVTTNTVLHRSVIEEADKRVGYLVFNSFIELSETELEQAFSYFKQQSIDELVVDVRYNGGGLIRVASQLASQIAWPAVQGKTFVTFAYNDKNSHKNQTSQFSNVELRNLTSLGLERVYVLTTPGSCSSSEILINSLSPFIDVVQVGEVTCGKPVGQQPEFFDAGRQVMFAVNFQTVNADGFGDYFEGLMPNCPARETIPGDWGVTSEALLKEALYYVANGSCSDSSQQLFDTLLLQTEGPVRLMAPKQNLAQPFWQQWNEH
ncbi:S41 family peptidase [Alkalimonas amylolytica]|uniref:Peptidase family S41 n=1 Tax=Alkalimonas amylolytica TaxID=152573 RepID=A0A1H3Y308_ALKAM|nr:S41 family peptidase [Alkalimonas amylolytica]SEA05953.1 Peptidase family S41 [Alkalimonas amylolytica]